MNQTPMEKMLMYLRARRPIIYIRNFDFHSVDRLIASVATEMNKALCKKYHIDEFSEATGRVNFKTKNPKPGASTLSEYLALYNTTQFSKDEDGYIVVLKEVHDSLNDKQVYSTLQTIAQRVKMSEENSDNDEYDVTIVIVDSKLVIPHELEKLVTVVDVTPPSDEEIENIIRSTVSANAAIIEDEKKLIPDLLIALRGLSEFEVRQIINLAIANDLKLDRDDLPLIHTEKRQAVMKSGLVEMIDVGNDKVGGLKKLRKFLALNGPIFKNPARAVKYGVGIPSGVMIVGMPGCGKSLTAKCIAKEFGVPLLKLDVGRLMGKYIGESEENLRRAIAVAETASPCILWVDEIEKAFSGIGENGGGGGVMTRMFGYFLTWMQEKKSCVYVVATANDISNLPPEFLRRGRFDEIFKVEFPNRKERADILTIQICKRNKGALPDGMTDDDIQELADLMEDSQNYSGADIESMVKDAMKQLFVKNVKSGRPEDQWSKLTIADMGAIIQNTKSSYFYQEKKLDEMRKKLDDLKINSAS